MINFQYYNDIIGWVGTILLTLCSFPQMALTWRKKNVTGLSISMIWLWLFGLLFMLVYVWNTARTHILVGGYFFEVFVVLGILYGYRRAQLYQMRREQHLADLEHKRKLAKAARKRARRKKHLIKKTRELKE